VGSIAGSLLHIEARLENLGAVLQRRFARSRARASSAGTDLGSAPDLEHEARERFVQGFLTASLVFCVGPLTILGSLDDGLGRGIDLLALKSTLDGFAAMAFASAFGVGVALSAASVAVVQGGLTLLGWALGDVLPAAHISALTATGGLLLAGIGIRLLRLREVPVGDMLPALLVAPLLTQLVVLLR
jgi:uncharacterized membrane protein YqgA involved in biofilm formation